jgi:hypothetical protein
MPTGQIQKFNLASIVTKVVLVLMGMTLLVAPSANMGRASAALFVVGTCWPGTAQPIEEPEMASVAGTITDENGNPIHAAEVALIPQHLAGDKQWYSTTRDWSNASGAYEFRRIEPGEYLLAFQVGQAPDDERPFGTTYYPGVEDKSFSQTLLIVQPDRIEVPTIRLRRIATERVAVRVVWKDGSLVERSNLLFHNPSYPHSAVIGGTAPFLSGGLGYIDLPVGFEYWARAKVDCHSGATIETRESRPIHTLRVDTGRAPTELTFVIPSTPCKFWRPR